MRNVGKLFILIGDGLLLLGVLCMVYTILRVDGILSELDEFIIIGGFFLGILGTIYNCTYYYNKKKK